MVDRKPIGKSYYLPALFIALLCTLTVAACAFVPQAHADTAAAKRATAASILQQIDSLQTTLNQARQEYAEASAEHEEAVAKQAEAAQQIEEETQRIEKLQEKLSALAVSMYKDHGASTFLMVLLQAQSFNDFIYSWHTCEIISNTANDLIAEEKDARAKLEEAQTTYEQQATRAEQRMQAATSSMARVQEAQAQLSAQAAKLQNEANEEEAAAADRAESDSGEESQEEVDKRTEAERAAKQAADAAATAAAAARAEAGASVLMGSGYFTDPCPGASFSSGFGYRDFDHAFHKGIDLAAPEGTPYYAADSGTVIYATNDGLYNGGAGNWVVISHGNGIVTKYMHSLVTFVRPGDQVERGQNIGLVGNTGNSYGAHLHFQVEVDGAAVNPLNYL